MAKVLGIGGVFFKCADPQAVRDWYARVLGVEFESWGGAAFAHPASGVAVFSPFEAGTTHFEPSTKPFMINLIVDDLDAVLEQAKSAGTEPLGRDDSDPSGRFAWVMDPEGVKVELWQPVSA